MLRRKNWNDHVQQTEELARTLGFRRLRDRIVTLAEVASEDVVVDIGSGTGLISLALAPSVKTVWAIDASAAMSGYLRVKAASAGLNNIEPVTANAVSLPLVDGCATVVVSNYCFHHLSDPDKRRALAEAFRVLRPGGRIVLSDMMFRVDVADERSRRVIEAKLKSLWRRGPKGAARLMTNAVRYVTGRWEQPADGEWWRGACQRTGFEHVEVQLLHHEGGILTARRPARSPSRRNRASRASAVA